LAEAWKRQVAVGAVSGDRRGLSHLLVAPAWPTHTTNQQRRISIVIIVIIVIVIVIIYNLIILLFNATVL
jgi:heme/copper-type cytochrome/quinol oxidase subunit 2